MPTRWPNKESSQAKKIGKGAKKKLGFSIKQRVTAGIATHPKEHTITRTLDQRINSLRPGHEIELSRSNGFWVTAERSGCGKWLRFVRHHANGFEVIKTSRF